MKDYNTCVQEKVDEHTASYTLVDESILYETGIKVLEYQSKYGLLNCMRLFQNGHIKLVYNYGSYKTLRQYVREGTRQGLLAVLHNIVDLVSHIEENGFLKCENIDVNVDKIFVNTNDLSVKLICLPLINVSKFTDRDTMLQVLRDRILFITPAHMEISEADLNNILLPGRPIAENETVIADSSSDSCENIEENMLNEENHAEDPAQKKGLFSRLLGGKKENRLRLLKPDERIEFVIEEEPFILGKDSVTVNGVIVNHNTVSRRHCRIIYDGKKHYVIDMDSKNGTFVNEKRVIPNQKTELRKGDMLRLADMEFFVR